MASFTRVLVANRGEIALRIIRACHEEGLESVAVYSDADRLSPHVRAAHRAVPIGAPPAAESYLDVAKLLEAARATDCQAVHIGPPATAIRAMGDKTEARRRMQAAGVPIVPGTTRPVADHVQAKSEAGRLGLPVLLKAIAGGGGKGMRLIREEGELESAFETAQSEALKAFGAGELYVEKYLERPRHIEVQVLADTYGRVVALGERECSIQRRHQKLIEEAPSVAVTPALRRRLSEAATAAAGSVGYLGAGTIEFLLAPTGEFYFLEMNTRLQVEHPVTELVYGVDIVREQLRVAQGQPLRVHSGALQPRGHAIECRITAEDPFNDFLPATGVIRHLQPPSGPGVRWDAGVEAGNEVTLFYDPLLAKLIVWGDTRATALQRMRRALRELVIVGLPSSQSFHLRVMADPEFQRGDVDVTYFERVGQRLLAADLAPELAQPLAIAAALLAEQQRAEATPPPAAPAPDGPSPWLLAARRESIGG
ncbi:MAG: hypothetical protein AUH06_01940 [Gemmatimonadetes bacterium 13_2_20CM_69_27]|nr:MAG: hypothetical protein AUH06_01940 [Gemmatimonadetes bacterium 13_2_20CM_69_27]